MSDDAYVEDYCLRMSNAVDMMTTLLQHDEGFMNRERFDLICSPMVNEVKKTVKPAYAQYGSVVETCIHLSGLRSL